jgi:hypothetical protein
MANITRVTVGSQAKSQTVPQNIYGEVFNVGIGVKLLPVGSATLTYTVEHTFDDVYSPSFDPATATWYSNATVVSKTVNADGNYAFPVTGIRLNVTSWTSGTATLTITQSGY